MPALIPAAVLTAYLVGSLNFAIIITRLVRGVDIRTLGNQNPGTSNVAREVGRGWGILVMVFDGLKALLTMIPARIWLFNQGTPMDYGALYMMGIAAVLGHIFPLWHQFKGGGGVATLQGVSLWFIPAEYLSTMLVSGLIARLFIYPRKYWLAQWTPIIFITLTPFVTLVLNLTVNVPLFAGISLGGHPWPVVAGCFALSLLMLAMNIRLLKAKAAGKEFERH